MSNQDFFFTPLSSDIIQNDDETSAPSHISDTRGLQISGQEGIESGITGNLVSFLHAEYERHVNPGPLLTPQEWKDSSFSRPGIDSKALMNSNGLISQNLAQLAMEKNDNEQERQFELQRMRPGLISGAARFAGSQIGQLLDPANILSFGLAEKFLGPPSAAILNRLEGAGKVIKFSAKALLGAGVVATAMVPQTLIQYSADDVLGKDPSVAHALATLSLNAGLGGLIHGVVGFRKPIEKDSFMQARANAVAQMQDGKTVNVEPILRAGYNAARDEEKVLDASTYSQKRNEFQDELNNLKDSTRKKEEKLSSGIQAEEEKGVQAGKSITSKDKGPNILKRLLLIDRKSEDKISDSDRNFIKTVPETDEIKRSLRISKSLPEERTPEDSQFLNNFLGGNEEAMIKERMNAHENEIQRMQNELKNTTQNFKQASNPELENDILSLQEKQKIAKTRLKQLGKRIPKRFKELDDQIKESRDRIGALKHVIKSHEVAETMANTEKRPLTYEDIQSASDTLNSVSSEDAYDPAKLNQFVEETVKLTNRTIDDDSIKEAEDTVDALKADDELSAEDKQDIEDIEKLDKMKNSIPKIKTAMDKSIQCLAGEEGG